MNASFPHEMQVVLEPRASESKMFQNDVDSFSLQKSFRRFGLRWNGVVVLDTFPLVDLLLELAVEVLHSGRCPPFALLFVM